MASTPEQGKDPINPPTQTEREALRAAFDYVMVSATSSGDHLHLVKNSSATQPLCARIRTEDSTKWTAPKPIEVYPPGFREWCKVRLEV